MDEFDRRRRDADRLSTLANAANQARLNSTINQFEIRKQRLKANALIALASVAIVALCGGLIYLGSTNPDIFTITENIAQLPTVIASPTPIEAPSPLKDVSLLSPLCVIIPVGFTALWIGNKISNWMHRL